MVDIATKIKRYTDYFNDHVSKISSVQEDQYQYSYRKLLYIAVIDAMSKTAFPFKRHRDRFISFVKTFSDWEHGERISLTHLVQLLNLNPDPAYEKVRQFANNEIMGWVPGDVVTLDRDPWISSVLQDWPNEKEYKEPIEGVSLESIKHWSLFYTYRNSLVHELRAPGVSLDDIADQDPAYTYLAGGPSDISMSVGDWILSYPIHFFHKVCKNCINNLNYYFFKNKIDPLQHLVSGSYFIEELNT